MSGDPKELERLLVGRRIWVAIPDRPETGIIAHTYDCRVLSFHQFLPADEAVNRKKHLVQVWTDPGGMRVLSVGSIHLKDPGRVAAAFARHAAAAR